jgi:hypothetical protein
MKRSPYTIREKLVSFVDSGRLGLAFKVGHQHPGCYGSLFMSAKSPSCTKGWTFHGSCMLCRVGVPPCVVNAVYQASCVYLHQPIQLYDDPDLDFASFETLLRISSVLYPSCRLNSLHYCTDSITPATPWVARLEFHRLNRKPS